MVVSLLLLVRFMAAAYIIAAGVTKLIAPRISLFANLPAIIKLHWKVAARTLGAGEIAIGLFVMADEFSRSLTASLLIAFGSAVTIYGLISISRTGECGCGVSSGQTSVGKFVARNLAIFVGAVAALLATSSHSADIDETLMMVRLYCIMPLIVLAYGIVATNYFASGSPRRPRTLLPR